MRALDASIKVAFLSDTVIVSVAERIGANLLRWQRATDRARIGARPSLLSPAQWRLTSSLRDARVLTRARCLSGEMHRVWKDDPFFIGTSPLVRLEDDAPRPLEKGSAVLSQRKLPAVSLDEIGAHRAFELGESFARG
jgi:hypothetical protein